jgi:nucleotide-binding universal stress UspA family protein
MNGTTNEVGAVLVPLDGSRLAEGALPYALALAGVAGARVLLLHVVPDVALTQRAEADLAAKALEVRHGGAGAPAGVTVESVVGCGDAARVIADVAAARGAGLIAMTTHGRSGLGRWLYGSVADGVLRRAPVPVLLVPATCEHPWPGGRPRRLLVPLDGSAYAEEALPTAAWLARAAGAELRLLRVVELALYPYGEGSIAVGYDPTPELAVARDYLVAVAARLRAAGLEVTARTDFGAPGQVIGEHAQVAGTDLVVMATHGWTGLARVVLGSVATGALQRANRPTLLVRPEAIRAAVAAAPEEPAEAGPPRGPAVAVALSLEELDLVQRGLVRLLGEVHPAEPVTALCARLRQAHSAVTAGPPVRPPPTRNRSQRDDPHDAAHYGRRGPVGARPAPHRAPAGSRPPAPGPA